MLQKVTDPVALAELARWGIDSRYVEFCQDYAPRSMGREHSPYAKFYRDTRSNKRLMVASGLPMVDAYGFRHELAWREKNGVLENGNNIFHCVIDKGTIRLIALSDQPTGLKKDDEASYHAQLFIGTSEVHPNSPIPILLATDPINENYHDNVILWSYGSVCKRRIRIIEGRFRERWVFESNPRSSVRIKHNFAGSFKLRLGYAMDAEGNPLQVSVIGDEEIVEASEFDKAVYPVEIGAEATYYPDVGTGNTTVDGTTLRFVTGGENWATIRAGTGTNVYPSHTDKYIVIFVTNNLGTLWRYLCRALYLFDSSGLPDACIITAATSSVRGLSKKDDLSIAPDINVYSSNPANNNDIENGDHLQYGTIALASAISYAAWNTAGYNDFTLIDVDADGFGYIKKAAGAAGITKLGVRNANYDVANHEPAKLVEKISELRGYFADQGDGYKPKLVITYTVVEGAYGVVV